MTQIECPTGHAVLPVPFTEAHRAPSLEEICEAQLWGREIEKIAVKMHPHFDFSAPKRFAAALCKKGRRIFNAAHYKVRGPDALCAQINRTESF